MQLLATSVVGATISWVLQIYILVLIARIVVDYVFMFARDWRPQGIALVLVNVFTVAFSGDYRSIVTSSDDAARLRRPGSPAGKT